MYRLISTILLLLVKMFRLLKVKGKEHIPSDERFVVTCSHRGWIDVIMLALALYPIPVHYMAKQELFKGKWRDRFFRSINAFPVNRENPGPSALKIPMQILKKNQCVGIFPSGTRTSEDVSLKRGAVTVALKSNAPILPAAYKGPTNFSGIWKGEKSHVLFGKPLIFNKEKQEMNRDELIEFALKRLETRIKELENDLEKE